MERSVLVVYTCTDCKEESTLAAHTHIPSELFQLACWDSAVSWLLCCSVRGATSFRKSPQNFLPSSLASRHPAESTGANRRKPVFLSTAALHLTDQTSLENVMVS